MDSFADIYRPNEANDGVVKYNKGTNVWDLVAGGNGKDYADNKLSGIAGIFVPPPPDSPRRALHAAGREVHRDRGKQKHREQRMWIPLVSCFRGHVCTPLGSARLVSRRAPRRRCGYS